MIKTRKLNPKAKSEINTGFGINSSDYGGRFLNKNGQPNIEKRGLGYFEKISFYHILLTMPRWKFFGTILIFYFLINLTFGTIYFLLGVTEFAGIPTHSKFDEFAESFFFSCQTFTTVGYGGISPIGFLAGVFSSFEALIGRFVVRCMQRHRSNAPRTIVARGSPRAFVELVRSNPDEFLELAWIVRKKPIWSPS